MISSVSTNSSITLTDQWSASSGSTATVGVLTPLGNSYLSLCWDLQNFLSDSYSTPVSVTDVYQVTPTSGQGTPPNAGEIAYLFNHYGTVDITNATADNTVLSQATPGVTVPTLAKGSIAEAVGLQVAIWELEYGSNFTSLQVLQRLYVTTPSVTAQELSDINTWATFYKNDAAGKSETATFLQVTNSSPLQFGQQGMITTGSLDFGNVAKSSPSITTVGNAIHDSATVTGGSSPTGTVSFALYSSATVQNSSTLVYADPTADSLVGGTATSANYTPTSPGTYYWVATYNGDGNNNIETSGASAEQVVVTKANTSLLTTASDSAGGVVGSAIPQDSAVLSGG
jgi:hypothetical protein